MSLSERDIEKVKEQAEEINEALEMAGRAVDELVKAGTPEKVIELADKVLPIVGPLFEKFTSVLWNGVTLEQLIVMGQANYLAKAMIEQGYSGDAIPEKAVGMAKAIVHLSKK